MLNQDADLDFADAASQPWTALPTQEPVAAPEMTIVWFDGNASADATQAAVEAASVNMMVDNDNSSPSVAEETSENTAPPADESQDERTQPELNKLTTSGKFFDAASTKLSNRLPVFDRYTWLALGREVPTGRSSVVSASVTRQLIQADYSLLPAGPLTAISSLSSISQHATSIDQIPISTTTDAALSEEIARNSLSAQTGVYLSIAAEEAITSQISAALESAKSVATATSHDTTDSFEVAGSFDSDGIAEASHYETDNVPDETDDGDSVAVSNRDTTENSADAAPQSISGLRIWRDGMLVFSNGESIDNLNASDSPVWPHVSDTIEQQAIETSTEASSTESASTDESFSKSNLLQLGAGGFFTLPDPKPRHADELNSWDISKEDDVYPFVEAIKNMRADVRTFQDTGVVPFDDSDPASRLTQSTDSATQSDNVVARAKRRLDERTNSSDTKTMALQISPEVRSQQKTQPEIESVQTSDESLNTESAPRFGRLFTRLRETRKLAADQAQRDA